MFSSVCFAGKRGLQRICSLSDWRSSQNVQLYLSLCECSNKITKSNFMFDYLKICWVGCKTSQKGDIVRVFGIDIVSYWCWQEDDKQESHFHIAVSCIAQSLKAHIINRSNDEIAICFFNTVSFWMRLVVIVFFLSVLFTYLFSTMFLSLAAWKEESSGPKWCLCL